MRKNSMNKILYLVSFIFLFAACKKSGVNEIDIYAKEKQWLYENGGVYKNGTLIFKSQEGNVKKASLNWPKARKFSVDGVSYTEIPFSFGEKEGNIRVQDNPPNLSFSIVFRVINNKPEASIKLTQWNAKLTSKSVEKSGTLETYLKLDGTWINTWFRENKTGRLMKRKGQVQKNNIKLASVSLLPKIQPNLAAIVCDTYYYDVYEYRCWSEPSANPNDYNTHCGYVYAGSYSATYCYETGGGSSGSGGSEWPPSGGGGSTNPTPSSPPDCATFENKVQNILNHEGGFTNNANDPGGATNKGISWDVWQANAQSILGVEPTLQNLQNLTTDQAKEIYRALYWTPIHADEIVDGDMRYLLFDFFVNAGGNAVKVLQRTINQLGGSVVVDGKIGPNTINAINSMNTIDLYNTYKANRQQYYNNLAAKSAKLATFLNGWTNRVNSFINKTSQNYTNVNC